MSCVLFPSKVLMPRKEHNCWKLSCLISAAQLKHPSTERTQRGNGLETGQFGYKQLMKEQFLCVVLSCVSGVEV